ncbi:hypothetical protein TTRE_0000392301 [Trichuris trichiura]|uniref:FAD/NAD(P)-binding domain-containing protein n=1 Tax=Trichuris trichiura TaxID=36087 RepID=A0A077ZAF9_TRITR|nr:hypothetical protein TTRE_0000392301 [Trichuris trichiura]
MIIVDHPNVIGIRDTETVEEFGARLKNVRRIVVVGNGGIATEIVGEVSNVEIIWAVKHESISAAFVDAGAAQFFLPYLNKENTEVGPKKGLTYTHHVSDQSTAKGSEFGSALGPDWIETCEITAALEKRQVHIEYKCAVKEVLSKEQCLTLGLNEEKLPPDFIERGTWPVYIRLSNDNVVGCDFVVSATGVVPKVRTFVIAKNPVILIGCFNGQGLRPDHEALVRIACGEEYIKILFRDGYVQGAVLIDETGLEEVVENLIMNHMDISRVKDDLLNPTIDLEDYFD